MRILLTNDDGIDAHGLHVLAAALRAARRRDRRGPGDQPDRRLARDHALADDRGRRGRSARRAARASPSPARRATACASPCSGSPSAPTSSSRARIAASTWATTSPTRAPSRPRSRASSSGLPRSRSPSRRRGGIEDWYDDASFDYGPTCAVVARLAERVVERRTAGWHDPERQRAGMRRRPARGAPDAARPPDLRERA